MGTYEWYFVILWMWVYYSRFLEVVWILKPTFCNWICLNFLQSEAMEMLKHLCHSHSHLLVTQEPPWVTFIFIHNKLVQNNIYVNHTPVIVLVTRKITLSFDFPFLARLPGTQQSPSTESWCKILISSPSKVHIMCKQEQNTHVCTPLGCTAHYLPCIVQSRRHTGME